MFAWQSQVQAESYALEIAIHRKRAEREKRRQELDAEFAAVFQDVQRKKQALGRLEVGSGGCSDKQQQQQQQASKQTIART